MGFKAVRAVHKLSDTEGADLAPRPVPGWDEARALDNLGIRRVPFQSTHGKLPGYSYGTEVAVNPIAVNQNTTLMHELAHVVLGHTIPHHYEEYQTHWGVKEFQAEGTAYIVMNELGQLDEHTAEISRGYIRHWLQEETPPDQAIRQVLRGTRFPVIARSTLSARRWRPIS